MGLMLGLPLGRLWDPCLAETPPGTPTTYFHPSPPQHTHTHARTHTHTHAPTPTTHTNRRIFAVRERAKADITQQQELQSVLDARIAATAAFAAMEIPKARGEEREVPCSQHPFFFVVFLMRLPRT